MFQNTNTKTVQDLNLKKIPLNGTLGLMLPMVIKRELCGPAVSDQHIASLTASELLDTYSFQWIMELF